MAQADSWIDEDGGTIVRVKGSVISIFSLDSFYYFDQILSNVRKNQIKIRVCLGFGKKNKTGQPTDCIKDLSAHYSFHNKGKNRAIHVKLSSFSFLLSAFEDYLISGRTMKISIDDGDLYSVYTLNKKHLLTKESENVLALPD